MFPKPPPYMLGAHPGGSFRPVSPLFLHCPLDLLLRRYVVINVNRCHGYWDVLPWGWGGGVKPYGAIGGSVDVKNVVTN